MNELDPSRSIRATFEGPGIEPGWVPVPDLLAVLDGLQSAVTIVMEDLWGRIHTRGRVPADIQGSATFRFGDVRAGSFSATIQLARPGTDQREMFDMQPRAVDRLMSGIEAHAEGRTPDLPAEAVRHVATVAARIRRGADRLVLEGGSNRRRVILSAETVAPPDAAAGNHGPRTVRVSGRLMEIDYRDRSAEVWDPLGHMTRIRFAENQRAQVDAVRQQHVLVEGVVEVSPSGRSGPVSLSTVSAVRMDDSFWRSRPLAQMAEQQGVRPIPEPASLSAAFWEEDDEEEFLAAVRRWRQEP